MILPDVVLPSSRNQHFEYSGCDSPEKCLDKKHFQDYPHAVTYEYNSRGFRDAEWPHDLGELRDAIWCIGDSFTVGLGQPLPHIWPQILQTAVGRRCINISMDGASNDWIARKAQRILQEVCPDTMIIMWSYLHRRELLQTDMTDEKRRLHFDAGSLADEDLDNFNKCVTTVQVSQGHTRLKMFMIPNFAPFDGDIIWNDIKGPSWPNLVPGSQEDLLSLPDAIKKELSQDFRCWDTIWNFVPLQSFINQNNITIVPQLDIARDGHHFDILTSRWVVDHIHQE
jgi:hypothetical protein